MFEGKFYFAEDFGFSFFFLTISAVNQVVKAYNHYILFCQFITTTTTTTATITTTITTATITTATTTTATIIITTATAATITTTTNN